jgi:hypothetical protein
LYVRTSLLNFVQNGCRVASENNTTPTLLVAKQNKTKQNNEQTNTTNQTPHLVLVPFVT